PGPVSPWTRSLDLSDTDSAVIGAAVQFRTTVGRGAKKGQARPSEALSEGDAAAGDGDRLLRDAGRQTGRGLGRARSGIGTEPAALVVGHAGSEAQAHVPVVSRPDPGIAADLAG